MTRPRKTIVILQSNYLPWKGYLDLIAVADEFLIFDEVQFTRRDWRNRNKVVVGGKPRWLTIPVQSKGRFDAPIDEIEVDGEGWTGEHWRTIELNYRRAPFFDRYAPGLAALYAELTGEARLTVINERFLRLLASFLAINTPLIRTRSIPRTTEDPTGRLIELCLARGATHYISGPAAKAYIDPARFEAAGLDLSYATYRGYPTYDQGGDSFEHGVSVVDLLMRTGPEARSHLRSVAGDPDFLDFAVRLPRD